MAHSLIALFLLIFWTASLWSAPKVSSPGAGPGSHMGCGQIAGKIWKTDASGIAQCSDDAGAASGAPTTSTYLLRTLDGSLPNAQVMASLASCLVANTTGTGIQACYGGTGPVANQFLRSLTPLGVGTFSPVAVADLSFDPATQAEFDAHLNNTTNAHAASAITFAPASTLTSVNAQAAIVEALADAGALVTAHTGNATGAHAASAISFAPDGSLGSTNAQAAIVELRNETPRVGGTSPCGEAELFKTVAAAWQCAPDATGGAGGTPGGSTTQIQVNNAGAFAGFADFTRNTGTGVITANGFSGPLFGNATTATALAADGSNAAPGNAILGVDASGNAQGAFDVATQIELDAHLNDTTDAHAASAIGFTPTGTIAATNAQAAIAEVASEAVSTLASHEADTTAVHGIADTSLLALSTDPRFPTTNEKAALAGTSGTAPSVSNKLVDNADNRLAAVQTPSALSAASQINADKPTQIITGSGGPVTLTNPKWLTDGDFPGQTVELFNPSATNTVTGPTTATILNCGGIGSVVIGLNQETPKYTWTGAAWQLGGCINLQHVTNAGPKVIGGFTTAAPLQLRGGTADAPSTTGEDKYDDGAGNWITKCRSAGADCDDYHPLPVGKDFIVANNAGTVQHLNIDGDSGVWHGANVPMQIATVTLENVTDTDDAILVMEAGRAVKIAEVACRYYGTAPTTAPTFSISKGNGTTGITTMTHTPPTCVPPGTVLSFAAITDNAASSVAVGLPIVFSVGNTPNPLTKTYSVTVRFRVTD